MKVMCDTCGVEYKTLKNREVNICPNCRNIQYELAINQYVENDKRRIVK